MSIFLRHNSKKNIGFPKTDNITVIALEKIDNLIECVLNLTNYVDIKKSIVVLFSKSKEM